MEKEVNIYKGIVLFLIINAIFYILNKVVLFVVFAVGAPLYFSPIANIIFYLIFIGIFLFIPKLFYRKISLWFLLAVFILRLITMYFDPLLGRYFGDSKFQYMVDYFKLDSFLYIVFIVCLLTVAFIKYKRNKY